MRSLSQIKQEIKKLLGRDVEVEKTVHGRFIPMYHSYNMKPTDLVADTEELALAKLLVYLENKKISDIE